MGVELFHLLNRGVDKRNIFLDNGDRARFVHNLYEFNDETPAPDSDHHPLPDIVSPDSKERALLVNIHGWVLMKNHYHLLVSERVENGISLFIRKLNVGYAKYFNERYDRVGTLFQGRTKKILIDSDSNFLYILHYIHLNPLDFSKENRKWREGAIKNSNDAIAELSRYRWSSYRDYCRERNFPSVVTTEFFDDVFEDYRNALRSFLKDLELDAIRSLLLE